jgi:hypothetical protein
VELSGASRRCTKVLRLSEKSGLDLPACTFRPELPSNNGVIACGASDGALWVIIFRIDVHRQM